MERSPHKRFPGWQQTEAAIIVPFVRVNRPSHSKSSLLRLSNIMRCFFSTCIISCASEFRLFVKERSLRSETNDILKIQDPHD